MKKLNMIKTNKISNNRVIFKIFKDFLKYLLLQTQLKSKQRLMFKRSNIKKQLDFMRNAFKLFTSAISNLVIINRNTKIY